MSFSAGDDIEMEERLEEQLTLAEERELTIRFRLLGLFPLAFFLAQAYHYWRYGGFGNVLWMCNIGNLLMAIGILFDQAVVTRAAAIWTIPGLFIWFWYVVMQWEVFPSSTLAHVGGIIIGMVALNRVRVDRRTWLYGLGWYLVMQFASRLATNRKLNVNAAHDVYPGWDKAFNSYWKFWLVMTLVTGFSLWLLGLVLSKLWPVTRTKLVISLPR